MEYKNTYGNLVSNRFPLHTATGKRDWIFSIPSSGEALRTFSLPAAKSTNGYARWPVWAAAALGSFNIRQSYQRQLRVSAAYPNRRCLLPLLGKPEGLSVKKNSHAHDTFTVERETSDSELEGNTFRPSPGDKGCTKPIKCFPYGSMEGNL